MRHLHPDIQRNTGQSTRYHDSKQESEISTCDAIPGDRNTTKKEYEKLQQG